MNHLPLTYIYTLLPQMPAFLALATKLVPCTALQEIFLGVVEQHPLLAVGSRAWNVPVSDLFEVLVPPLEFLVFDEMDRSDMTFYLLLGQNSHAPCLKAFYIVYLSLFDQRLQVVFNAALAEFMPAFQSGDILPIFYRDFLGVADNAKFFVKEFLLELRNKLVTRSGRKFNFFVSNFSIF